MRRGFTLVEVTIIVVIVSIVAVLTIPNVAAMARGRQRDEQYNDILRLAQMGREAAVKNGQTYVLTVSDGSGTVVTLAPEDAQDSTSLRDSRTTTTTTTSTGGKDNNQYPPLPNGMIVGSSMTSSDTQQNLMPNDDPSRASASLPSGATIGQLNLGSQTSSTSDFKLHFYPEGRSEGGAFEMVEGVTTRLLTIDRSGFATLKEGNLTPATEQSWEAGTYEQRASS